MKEIFIPLARFNNEANKAAGDILAKMDEADREKNRKSYYGSLSGIYRHLTGGTCYFLSLMGKALSGNAAAQKALAPLAKVEIPGGKKLTGEEWARVEAAKKIADKAFIAFVEALEEKDYTLPVEVPFYKGKPPAVPLYFLLQVLNAHGIHHRGQISQILDSLGIDNDYSGINVKFLVS
jgi:uncharacterized damage-inducible protein DinB